MANTLKIRQHNVENVATTVEHLSGSSQTALFDSEDNHSISSPRQMSYVNIF